MKHVSNTPAIKSEMFEFRKSEHVALFEKSKGTSLLGFTAKAQKNP